MLLKNLAAFLFGCRTNRLIQSTVLLVISTSLYTTTANAQQQPTATFSNHEGWYQVEMIVFARNDSNNQEHWPSNIKLRYPSNWVELKSSGSGIDTTKEQFYMLPANERLLNAQAQKLQRSGRNEVLFHNAWRQVITNKNSAKSIIITGGQTFGQHQSLEGSIRLSVATYLELQTNLWFAQFESNTGTEPSVKWPELPVPPTKVAATANTLSADSEMELEQALANDKAQQQESNSSTTQGSAFNTSNIILLQQERDMRSNEIHYIDHPVVGIIIQITPYPPVATPSVSSAE
ncbi:MAG: CsiV family protein [Cellvibrio sp.]|uniref:CsiV family protein n=1 Tax=Cellvibrio sp. TaxID=1965322 RepID=UPI0031A1089F